MNVTSAEGVANFGFCGAGLLVLDESVQAARSRHRNVVMTIKMANERLLFLVFMKAVTLQFVFLTITDRVLTV